MGLGKTITLIGTMFVNFLPKTLIVVPPVLVQQWYQEIYKASGHKALVYYGAAKKNISQSNIANALIVITSYNSIMSDKSPLRKIVWNRVIFDEAHHLRNAKTKRFHSCKKIRANIRWLITGTPIQNKIQDFYNLCNAFGMKPDFYRKPDNLPIIRNNFVLRRTKAQVGIILPSVYKNELVVPWTNMKEKMIAEEIHSLLPNQSRVSPAKMRKLAAIFGPGGILVAFMRSKQSCIMPSLMNSSVATFIQEGILDENYACALQYNSKLDSVINLMLERKDNGKGKIVFCNFKSEIDTIAEKLRLGGMKKVSTYDGRVGEKERANILSDAVDALVMQIQTGCEGLNLQKNFSEIYFVSPHWNPSIEDQAIARCHRIGQVNPVNVFKFEMQGFGSDDSITLEKYINRVQEFKRDIGKQFLDVEVSRQTFEV
jgi:SNF2 family DNA or RNA helicase